MKNTSPFLYLGLPLFLLVAVVLNLSLGSVSIPLSDVVKIATGSSVNGGWDTIIWELRMPKMITAIAAGAGLGLSGLLMQTLFRNPLAGPFVLGISSGASLGVALLIMATQVFGFVWLGGFWGEWALVMAAVLGSSMVLLLIIAASYYIADSMTLLIIGLMLGSLSGALVSILQYFSQAEQIQSYLIWTFGNLGGVHGSKLIVLLSIVFIGTALALLLIKPLNSLLLGETYAKSMGVSIKSIRILIVLSTALLAGGITAFCGPLAFIGIAIPHLARVLFKSSHHGTLIPATLLLGSIVMLLCDTAAQAPGFPQTLPINAITSLIGAPAVIAILIRNRQLGKSFAK